MTDGDKKLIDDAMENARKRTDKFFNHFGLRGEDRVIAEAECEQFIEDALQAEKKLGKSFYGSPLGRKAFMIVYFRGRASSRLTVSTNDEKQLKTNSPNGEEKRT